MVQRGASFETGSVVTVSFSLAVDRLIRFGAGG